MKRRIPTPLAELLQIKDPEYWTHQCRIKDTDVTTDCDSHCYFCGLKYREWLDEKRG